MANASAQDPTKTNQRLFNRIAKVFSECDVEAFTLHAEKLAAWLSDHKAYYAAARPEIIKLMMIAQMTLRKVLSIGDDLSVPFKASDCPSHPMVPPYIKLVKAIEPYQSHFVEPNLLTFFKSIIATASQDPSPDAAEASSPTPIRPVLTVSNTPPLVQQAPTSNAPLNSQLNVQTSNQSNLEITTEPSPDMQNSTPISDRPSAPRPVKPKAKKRKPIDFELLVRQDIQGLLQRKGVAKSAIYNADAKMTQAQAQLQSPPIAQPEASIPSSVQNSGISAMVSTLRPSDDGAVPEFSKTKDKGTSKSSPDVNGKPLSGLDVQAMDLDKSPSKDDQTVEALDTKAATFEPAAMEVDTTYVPEDNQPVSLQIINADLSLNGTPSQIESDKQMAEPANPVKEVAQEPREPVSMEVDHADKYTPPSEQAPLSEGIFGPDMRLIASQRGQAEESKISIQFDIAEDQFSLVSAWVNRKTTSQDVSSTICLTLGCYLEADLEEQARTAGLDTREQQVSFTRSNWPDGGLMMNAVSGSLREELPLSPPFLVTPDNAVDISPFLVCGKNVIRLTQHRDLTQYRFMLHAHHPTQAQLRQLADRRNKNQQWQDWLRTISAPIDLPLRPTVQL